MRQCCEENILGWLVHLDLDELLYFPSGVVSDYFDSLAPHVLQITMVNHEGIPTTEEDVDNYFISITRFKRNHLAVPLSSAAHTCMNRWRARTTYRQYMLAYDNGKSAVRIQSDLVPASVHKWKVPNVNSVCNFADPRHLQISHVVPTSNSPCILHYPVCGYNWLHAKYATLGTFPNAWFNGKLPMEPCFYTHARDVYQSCEIQRDWRPLQHLYRTQVMLQDDDAIHWEEQLQSGVCMVVNEPSQRLQALLGDKSKSTSKSVATSQALRSLCTDEKHALPSSPSWINSESNKYSSAKAWVLASVAQKYLNAGS
jgi:hypothetical protein